MRYYEIVFMIHPDCGEQISKIIDYYTGVIVSDKGKIFRTENWGRRQLAYPIKKVNKAYYILLNIIASTDTIIRLNDNFRFNDSIIRSMIIRTNKSVGIGPSPMMKNKEKEDNQGSYVSEVSINNGK